jgi:hypothetical protein
MAKIPVWMDLISGILLSIEFIPKNATLTKLYNWTQQALAKSDSHNPRNKYTILTNLTIGVFMFVLLLSWAWYKTSNSPSHNIGLEIGLFAAGILAGCILITVIAILLQIRFKAYWSEPLKLDTMG